MLLVSYRAATPRAAILHGDRVHDIARLLDGAPSGMNELVADWSRWGEQLRARVAELDGGDGVPLADAPLCAPLPEPRRNPFAVAGNYAMHVDGSAARVGAAIRERPRAVFFSKPTHTVTGPNDPIEYDAEAIRELDYEAELAVVLARGGRDIAEADAMEHVLGYTIVNDVSARDLQILPRQIDYLAGKGRDTFMPMGPGIVLRDDVEDYRSLRIRLWVNDELRQSAAAGEMTRGVEALIAELSRGMTLLAGDVIATGTPAGVAMERSPSPWLRPGDVVRTEIEGIGMLVNEVRDVRTGAGRER